MHLKQIVLSILSSVVLHDPYPIGYAPQSSLRTSTNATAKSIAIVGAGSAGLAVLKTLLDLPISVREDWNIVLFEQRRDVGGVWLPDLNDPHPPDLPETPLYPELRTNTPSPSMTYPSFPFREMTPLFPGHDHVWQYHSDYAVHFNLTPHIRLNNTVTSTAWVGNASTGHWNVTVSDELGRVKSGAFDHLVVANGHNHYPYTPSWSGQELWLASGGASQPRREILHSIFWRNGSHYVGRSVLVVGGGASGRDAVLHTARAATKVFLSLRDTNSTPRRLPVPYSIVPEIAYFTPTSIVFKDGSSDSTIDSIILATGYELHIPFLTAGGALTIDPTARTCPEFPSQLTTNLRYLFPLHEHIFSLATAYPTNALAFVGLPILVANCPSDIAQALLVAHGIANDQLLPSRQGMRGALKEREQKMRQSGLDPYYVGHRLVDFESGDRGDDGGSGGDGRKPDMSHDYQDALVRFLKKRGALPDDGKPFVEEWRRWTRGDSEFLWRAWARIEEMGSEEVRRWLGGVKTEEEWADLMKRMVQWEKEQEPGTSGYE